MVLIGYVAPTNFAETPQKADIKNAVATRKRSKSIIINRIRL